ncbi:lysozyme inhibitor LprI family protein [Agrobacterium tumefaciens]|uniref:lysozyme inhibitor LprI family protein n=1 Tax=Agrobacterium tumefaciens TaxID=358 RepID=UPI0006851AE9
MKVSWAANVITAILMIAGISPVVATSAVAASFDCRKASSADERAICSNDELSALDDAVAAGFRQARKTSPSAVKPLSRSLLAERNACGGDVDCLKSVMTKAIGAYKSVILGDPVDVAGEDKNKVYYGSRAGMQVSVVSRKGLNTPNAVITVEHRRDDAVAYCRDYVQNVTDKCIADQLAIKLNDRFSGNCKTGRFRTVSNQTYVFLGRNPSGSGTMGNQFVLIDGDTNQPLDGSMASGYPVALPQFQALCPAAKLLSK